MLSGAGNDKLLPSSSFVPCGNWHGQCGHIVCCCRIGGILVILKGLDRLGSLILSPAESILCTLDKYKDILYIKLRDIYSHNSRVMTRTRDHIL